MVKQYGAQAVLGDKPLDIGLLHRASTLQSIYRAVTRVRGLVGEAIHEHLSDSDRATIAWLRREGMF
jgi:hypothetical protein